MFLGETTELSKLPWIRTPTKGQSPALLLKGCLTPVELSKESPLFPSSPSATKSPRTPRTPRSSAPSSSPSPSRSPYRRLSGTSKRDEAKSFIFDSILGRLLLKLMFLRRLCPLFLLRWKVSTPLFLFMGKFFIFLSLSLFSFF